MKTPPPPKRLRSLSTAAALALLGLPLHAAVVTWDNNGGIGNNQWSTAVNWDTNLEPTSADDVIFAAGLGATLTLATGENAKTLQFDDDYTLTGGGLTLAAASTVGVLLGESATVSTALTITGGTTKTGGGALTLSGSNTFTGGIIVSAGTLRVSNANAIGAAANVATVNSAATLEVTSGISFDRAITLNDGGTIAGSGTATYNGKVTIDALATSVNFATAALADVFIVGNGANDVTGGTATTTINITGPGAVRLGAGSDYDGSWNIASGARLELGATAALGDTAASGVTLAGGALSGKLNTATTFTGQTNLTLTASSSLLSDRGSSAGAGVTHTFGTVTMGAHTLTVAPGVLATSGTAGIVVGTVTLTGDATFAVNDLGAANGKLTTGALLGGGVARTLTKTGAGDLTLTGGATDLIAGSSFTMSGGGNLDLLFPALGAGASIAVTDAQHPLGASSFSMTGGTLTLLALGDGAATAQDFVLANGWTLAGDVTLDPNRTSGTGTTKTFVIPTLTLAAGASVSMAGDNTHNVRVAGAVTLLGNVTLQGTTLTGRDGRLTFSGAIGDGGNGYAVTIAAGGTIPLNLTLNSASTYSGGTTMTGGTATLNAANALGTGPLAQSGGTLVVTTDGAIGGAITLSGGTLQVNDINALAGNTIALNGGTLDLRTNAAATFTTGTLTLGGDATMNFARVSGSGSFTSTFGSPINVSGNRTLTITNANVLTPNLANIALAGDLTLNNTISVSVQAVSEDASPRKFIKAGTGTTTLVGAGTFTGGAEVLAGILSINDTGALGGSVLTVGDTSGLAPATATLGVGPSLANDIVIRGGGSGTLMLRTTTGGLAWAGDIALQKTVSLEGTSGVTTFSGSISGLGNVTKSGSGEIVLGNAANSFGNGSAASVNLAAGTLTVASDGALGAAGNGVTIGSGTTFRVSGTFGTARTITFSGATPNLEVTTGNTVTVNAPFAGDVIFDKEGAGVLAIGPGVVGTRSTTTNLRGGTLRLTDGTGLGPAAPVSIFAGTLELRNDTSTHYPGPITIGSTASVISVDRAVGGSATGGNHSAGTIALAAQTLTIQGFNGFGLSTGVVSTTGAATLNNDAPGAMSIAGIDLGGTSGTPTFTMDGEGGMVTINGVIAEIGTPIYNFAKRGSHTLRLGTGFVTRGTLLVADGVLDMNGVNIAQSVLAGTALTLGGGNLATASGIVTGAGTFTLGGNVTFSNSFSPLGASIVGNLDLGAATRTFTINDSGNAPVDLDLAGVLSGSVGIGFTKLASGIMRLSGAGNTFTGLTTVQVGTLELGKSSGDAIGIGGLSINNTSTATVRLVASNQINDAAAVAIINNTNIARLDLAGFSETVGATTITATTTSGALITTGAAGALTLGGDLTLANNASLTFAGQRRALITGTGIVGTPVNDGTLNLGGAVRNIAVTTTVVGANAVNANAIIETAIVNGGIHKTGPQVLYLTNPASTFAGGLNIAEGIVDVSASGAAGVGAITFNNTAPSTLRLSTDEMTLANPIVVSAAGAAEAKLQFAGGLYTEATMSGAITLERDLVVDVTTGLIDQGDGETFGRLILSGNIDDGVPDFSVTKTGNGVLRLTGTNTHSGGTFIEKGTLAVDNDQAIGKIGIPVTIDGGALHAEASFSTARDVVFTSAGSIRVDAPNVLTLTGTVTHGANDFGFFGSGSTIVSNGGGGAGRLIVGSYASDFADPGSGTPFIETGHVLSVRDSFVLPAGNIWLLNQAVLELGTGDFLRPVGNGVGEVRMETYLGAGFAAFGENRRVNLGGSGATLIVGDPVTKFLRGPTGFGFDNVGALLLGTATATHTVLFENALEFNNGDSTTVRSIMVPDGPAAKEAIISGDLSLTALPGMASIYLELYVDGALDITGEISGDISLNMFGLGLLTLTAANTFTGDVYVGSGILNVNSDAALGDATVDVSIEEGATLQAGGAITSSRSFFFYNGGLPSFIDTNGFDVTLDSDSYMEGDALEKIGAGTMTLAGLQKYYQLTAGGGTTNVNSQLGFGDAIVNANATVNFGASQTLAELNIGAGATVTVTAAPAPSVAAVPEPGSLALLAFGTLALARRRRR